ncbi:hypothetical protein CSQ92_27830 [Janthinobacterium sp. BJB446]|uniref:hypothetical protein n=1 Tax=Janthinobacterium sp. BJB446 TaxID=2048009 RepID=UPI000C101470|nr:hypothetical protein [Janthinobacterium sp. BJB446]PHV19187.1 hypothetical protein CSQ92_27830 [Janthinobacterium sp. BJB446]
MFDNSYLLKRAQFRLKNTPYSTVLCLAGTLILLMLAMVMLGGLCMVLGGLADEAWAVLESIVIDLVRQRRW